MAASGILAAAGAIFPAAQQTPPPASIPPGRILLQPRFVPGQILRYHVTLESDSSTRDSGAIQDPQGSARLGVTWDAAIRLEVSVASGPATARPARAAAAGPLRLRIVYESSQATVRSDSPDLRSDGIRQQYARLAGQSLEFTLMPGGRVSDVRGLDGIVADDRTRSAIEQWIVQLSAASAAPAGGVVPGQKWDSTQPAELPLAGYSWRTDSTYLRNEPCRWAASADAAAAAPHSGRADCAVILSSLSLITTRAMRDPTPDDYRRSNLHSSGVWTGSGQSLVYVSLDTGWVVSSTQESKQEMDVTISDVSPNPSGAVRHSGSITTSSQVALLNGDGAPQISPQGAVPAPSAR